MYTILGNSKFAKSVTIKKMIFMLSLAQISLIQYGQIIADHTIVDKFYNIPQQYIDSVKKMWVVVAGESHSQAYRTGLSLLEAAYPAFDVNLTESGTPEAYTTSHLRASKATWGDYNYSSGWQYNYGEEDWWTNATAISRTEAGIRYCNDNYLTISAMGFGWCWDMVENSNNPSATADPVYGVHWYGWSVGSPEGNKAWGLDDADNAITGNSVNLDTYLAATQAYIDYCAANNIPTKIFFTTGTVDGYGGEQGYQRELKNQRIRDYVTADASKFLFDYADILCYDDNGTPTTTTWNGHTFPIITTTNLGAATLGHIDNPGALRLGKGYVVDACQNGGLGWRNFISSGYRNYGVPVQAELQRFQPITAHCNYLQPLLLPMPPIKPLPGPFKTEPDRQQSVLPVWLLPCLMVQSLPGQPQTMEPEFLED